jgi:hypothetical protein
VIDTGTIIGSLGTAIKFGGANDLLKFNPSTSAKIQGTVDGGGGTDTLEFVANGATASTLTGVGPNFVNFGNGTIDSGASWVFAGSNTIGTGTTLTNSGTLANTGTLTTVSWPATRSRSPAAPISAIPATYWRAPARRSSPPAR